MSSCTVVVPCFNEARRLNLAAFREFVDSTAADRVRILFVDDGSTDGTPEVLSELERECPSRFGVKRLPRNVGKAEAVRAGLLEAAKDGPTFVAFWDADLATPLEDITAFIEILEARPEIEMVFGCRVNLLGRSIHRNSARHYVGRVFASAAAVALGISIYDTQCGAKMFRVSDRFVDQLQEPFIGGWIFDVEMIARDIRARRGTALPRTDKVIYEYPLAVWRDVAGSKIKVKDWVIVAASLGRIYFKYLWRRRERAL